MSNPTSAQKKAILLLYGWQEETYTYGGRSVKVYRRPWDGRGPKPFGVSLAKAWSIYNKDKR